MSRVGKYGLLMKVWVIVLLLFLGGTAAGLADEVPAYSGFERLSGDINRIVMIGDTQVARPLEFWREHNREETGQLFQEIARRRPAAIIHLGDLTTSGSSDKYWHLFDEFHRPVLEKAIPYFPILGNHEYNGDNAVALQNYFARFPHLAGRKWYAFDFLTVRFILLNSNFSELTPEEIRLQRKWYRQELAEAERRPQIRFIICCCHHPPFTNARFVKPDKKVRRFFVRPFLKTPKAAVFMSGHCHSYERFQRRGKCFMVSGGGGGSRDELDIRKGRQRLPGLFLGPSLRFFHFVELEILNDRLVFRVIRLTGDDRFEVADTFGVNAVDLLTPPKKKKRHKKVH